MSITSVVTLVVAILLFYAITVICIPFVAVTGGLNANVNVLDVTVQLATLLASK
jgi:hypothetical protein